MIYSSIRIFAGRFTFGVSDRFSTGRPLLFVLQVFLTQVPLNPSPSKGERHASEIPTPTLIKILHDMHFEI